MSISGNLEDVSVAEVMQFVHLGGRTGTLRIKSGDLEAGVGFHRGRIISAWSPGSKRLGELLIAEGFLDQAALDGALAIQAGESQKSLGQVLAAEGLVSRDTMREILSAQIARTVYDIVVWKRGLFEFSLDELRPVDEVGVYPGDILPDIDLNTQMVILEALRILDEKTRDQQEELEESSTEQVPGPAVDDLFGDPENDDPLSILDEMPSDVAGIEDEGTITIDLVAELGDEGLSFVEYRLHVVTEDAELAPRLTSLFGDKAVIALTVPMRDAGLTLPGEAPPLVLLDLRQGQFDADDLKNLCRTRARATIIGFTDGHVSFEEIYSIGAVAAVPNNLHAAVSCVDSVLRSRGETANTPSSRTSPNAGMMKLKRVIADLRSGMLSATVALSLMSVLAESVERAVLFLVRDRKLSVLGAFGFSMAGKPLAEITHDLQLELVAGEALSDSVTDGQARSMGFDESGLNQELAELLGRPHAGQVVIFPVLGSDRVICVVYTDNGRLSRVIREIDMLELAAAQVGVAYENELLRRGSGGEAALGDDGAGRLDP